jgi:hypothetical protein
MDGAVWIYKTDVHVYGVIDRMRCKDRILLYTYGIFSLTSKGSDVEVVRKCYRNRGTRLPVDDSIKLSSFHFSPVTTGQQLCSIDNAEIYLIFRRQRWF